jgi:hypothetical protein
MGAQTGQSCGLYATDRTASPTGGSIDADALSVSPARIANIGPRERQRRLLVGFIGLGIGIAVAAWLIASGAPPRWRLALFIPLFAAALGYFQARDKT